ncbi:pyridoxal phosphate-dependent transferase [Aspergillus sergii]|uniref:Pyridoxal phosphate-dependent transferase n=1 Tax=Aspergillus sergii TaxID=1034303 RepID=A0A5N6XEY8_9EURO|nr:pyridoxal phosphate-dependent transferase [Aspergillus sergii]
MTISSLPPPHMLPLGVAQPPGQKHAVSVSLPTWDSVPGRPLGKQWVIEKMQVNYPRFGIHHIVQKLADAVLERLNATPEMKCAVFPSEDACTRCVQFLQKRHRADVQTTIVPFFLSGSVSKENLRWARFYAVIYQQDAHKAAGQFWTIFGDGISSRHAEFCLERWPFMVSKLARGPLQSHPEVEGTSLLPVPLWRKEDDEHAKAQIKARIATWIGSDHPGFPLVSTEDVFLYPKGMCAISAVARALAPEERKRSKAVVFGWPYSETPRAVQNSGYQDFFIYSKGSQQDLDELESSLAAGELIQALFCEIPSNPSLHTPDLHRIRTLADRYGFCVVCDETIGTYVNVDILPYVDVAVTSLTKIFSGASNVMGGSAVINPNSRHYGLIHSRLTASYEDLVFPLDAMVLAENSMDFPERVLKCNANAQVFAQMLAGCPSIDTVYYPSMTSTSHLYERYRRKGGGNGFLLSILFRNPSSAVEFYNKLDICKGPSLGTNFSLAIPYAQLAHVHELDWAESKGVPKHIVRISAGLESEVELVNRIREALLAVEQHEQEVL